MRKLTVVGLKLLGILCIFWGLESASMLGFYLQMLASPALMAHNDASQVHLQIAGFGASCVIVLGFGPFLLLCTSWIADRMGLPDDPLDVTIEPYHFLCACFLMVGTYVFIEALPDVASRIYKILAGNYGGNPFHDPGITNLITPALRVVLGYIVIVRARHFARSVFPPAPPAAPAV